MFGLLVIDEDLEIVEVALTVVTPRPGEDFLRIWMTSLLFVPHVAADLENASANTAPSISASDFKDKEFDLIRRVILLMDGIAR